MSIITVKNITVKNNPAKFTDPFVLTVTFESHEYIKEEIEWKIIYIGCVNDQKHDQVLDAFTMGPLQKGMMQFELNAQSPDANKIPTKNDLLGVTALILSVCYAGKEFYRIGYYVYNYYTDQKLIEQDPVYPIVSKIERRIIDDKPRITIFNIFKKGKNGKLESITDGTFEAINKRLLQISKDNDVFERKQGYPVTSTRREEEEKSIPIPNESQEEGSVTNEDTTMDIEKGSFIDSKTVDDEEHSLQNGILVPNTQSILSQDLSKNTSRNSTVFGNAMVCNN